MKRYLALLLIAIVAASVISAAGVVTAKKPVPPPSTNIPYGVSQKWSKNDFNYHYTEFKSSQLGVPAAHSETSVGNTATVEINADAGEDGINYASVGVAYTLTGITNWDDVKDKPVAITVRLKYDLAASGSSGWLLPTAADVGGYPAPGVALASVEVQGTQSDTITQTLTTTRSPDGSTTIPLTVTQLVPDGASGDYSGQIWFAAVNGVMPDDTMTQHTYASITVSSISLEYL